MPLDTLTLSDACRLAGPMAFNAMIKPAGSLCNLACSYCYYLDKSDLYGGKEPKMSLDVLERCIKAVIDANDVPEVSFNWHGGEPLVMGLDFYREAIRLEEKYACGKTIHNTIQTNGTLLDARTADFLAQNNFLVGISIDGPRDLHDHYRKDRGGSPTFDKVVHGLQLLRERGVEFNTMTTVNHYSEGRGLEVYEFLKSLGSRYLQFMPVVEHIKTVSSRSTAKIVSPMEADSRLAPWSVSAIAYGRFLCDIFDRWVRSDIGNVFVGQFDAALASWCGAQPGICIFGRTCGDNSIIEHNGDLYCCDHFVYPEFRLGNILQEDIRTLMESPRQVQFGISKHNALPRKCLSCRWFFACHGECPKHRFGSSDRGPHGLNALCEGYSLFYSHVAPYMDKMKEMLSRGLPASAIIPFIDR